MKRLLPFLLLVATLAGCLGGSETATLVIDGPTQAETSLPFTAEDAPSASYYAEQDLAHPGAYTAFDLTVQWSQESGIGIGVGYFDGLGFYLSDIDGVGYDADTGAYWELWVDGEGSDIGMDQVTVTDGMEVAWKYVTPPPMGSMKLTVDPVPTETRDGTLLVTGSVDHEAQVFVLPERAHDTVGEGPGLVEGDWQQEVSLQPGSNVFTVLADDGTTSVTETFNITRLANATFEVQYGGFAPGQSDSSDEVWFDPDAYPATPHYEAEGLEHPPYTNVHDLMAAWEEQTGSTIEYAYSDTLQGFTVSRINGAGTPLGQGTAPPWWCYTVDGENPGAGISLQAFEVGTTVTWVLGDCGMIGA